MSLFQFNFDKTIVDSGTTNIRLPPKVYTEVVNLVRTQTIEPEVSEGYKETCLNQIVAVTYMVGHAKSGLRYLYALCTPVLK